MPARTVTAAGLIAVAVALAPDARAQFGTERIKIDAASVGLPPGRFVGEKDSSQRGAPVIKRNIWAPVYVRLELKKEVQTGIRLRVETLDADGLKVVSTYPLLKSLADRLPGSKIEATELAYVPYLRCGDLNGQYSLTIVSDDEDEKALSNTASTTFSQFRDVATYVVLSLGTRLPGFDLPASETKNPNATTRGGLRGGRVETAAITNVRELPDQWFGYQAADLVVLATGSATAEFLDDLFDKEKSRDFKPRRDALLEWVRRGGKLVISVGSNASKLAQSEVFRDLLPAPLAVNEPARAVDELNLRWKTAAGGPIGEKLKPREGKFQVARLAPNPARPPRVLVAESDENLVAADFPLVVQSPLGLGRVTVVAFDLDQSPFADSGRRADFWDYLIREGGSAKAANAPPPQTTTYGNYSTDTEDDIVGRLRQHVESFDGVPVISFGWVALFIVLYTLLIGPVEYLFLKKILGRLELTWVTFPLIVLSVSAAAYFTAYAIKGKDLKVNKVDVVDVDLSGGRVYGTTYFTIFSPRIDSYTIGVEPREGWAVSRPNEPTPPTLVDWMAGGQGGANSSSILNRKYSYAGEYKDGTFKTGEGLVKVPIQVWSVKAFTANWSGYLDRAKPLVQTDEQNYLFHPPGEPNTLAGSFVSNIPVHAIQDPVLFYAGVPYKLGRTLTPGSKVDVVISAEAGRPGALLPDTDWLTRNNTQYSTQNFDTGMGRGRGRNEPTPAGPANLSLWGALFHEKMNPGGRLANSSLRSLDQSWRLTEQNRDEAILVARLDTANKRANEILGDPAGVSPTNLWLKGLPQAGVMPPDVPGTLRQETYIRVYIPVKPAPPK